MTGAISTRPIRILIAKPGLDGHDRGARVVAAALRDAGMEVIYGGLWLTPEEIVGIAEQEDVDAVGLSSHNNAHMTLFPRVLELLRERGLGDVLLTGGGIILEDDRKALEEAGVGRLFGPGTPFPVFTTYIQEEVARRRAARAAQGARDPAGERKKS